MFSSVVLPDPVPPEITTFRRTLTQVSRKRAIGGGSGAQPARRPRVVLAGVVDPGGGRRVGGGRALRERVGARPLAAAPAQIHRFERRRVHELAGLSVVRGWRRSPLPGGAGPGGLGRGRRRRGAL